MSFRRILMSLLTVWLGLMGIAFGMLFLLCVCLFLFWQGLSVSVFVFGLLCMACLVLAGMILQRSRPPEKPRLKDAEPVCLSQNDVYLYDAPGRRRNVTRRGHSESSS